MDVASPESGSYPLDEIVLLAAVHAAGHVPRHGDILRRLTLPVAGSDRAMVDATCRSLVARCALRPAPRTPCGYEVSLIGLSRLHRFVRSPIGSAADAPIDAECAARRMVLEMLPRAERTEIETRLCAELVELREGVFRCAHADLCAGKGCPYAAAVTIETIDRGVLALTAGRAPGYLQ